MKTELILKSDVLDIIFENRNKAYGAYYLRKFYSNRLLKSLFFMLAGVLVLSAFTFIPKKKIKVQYTDIVTTVYAGIPEAKEKNKEQEKPKEVIQKKKAPTVGFTKPTIVKDNVPVKTLDAITDTVQIAAVTNYGDGNTQLLVGDTPAGTATGGGGDAPVTAEPAIDAETPTASADVMPEFPGGMPALRKFLERNLTNPRDMEENETVSVKMRFVVGYDGKLKSFETVEDGGEEFNREVLRVLKKMPEWVPGKTKGHNVSVYYTIPVKFVAQD